MAKTESHSVKGTWWVPDKLGSPVVGEFDLKTERPTLQLVGHFFGFGERDDMSRFTVWGTAVDGTPFSLFECFVRSSTFPLTSGTTPTAEIAPGMWIKGGHFRSIDEVDLSIFSCDLTPLVFCCAPFPRRPLSRYLAFAGFVPSPFATGTMPDCCEFPNAFGR